MSRPYRNPVHAGYFADPFVLPVDGGYLAVGTGRRVDGRPFEVLRSADLVRWESAGGALEPLSPELAHSLTEGTRSCHSVKFDTSTQPITTRKDLTMGRLNPADLPDPLTDLELPEEPDELEPPDDPMASRLQRELSRTYPR